MSPEPGARIEEARYRRILVAVDGSRNSDLALATALSLARRDNASISLVGVELDASGSTVQWGAVSAPTADLQDELRERCLEVLRNAREALPDDVPVTVYHRFGKAGPEIIAQSREQEYDLILLGSRGVGRVGSLLGSVSQHVLHNARTNVMVVHSADGEGPTPE